VPYDLTGKRAIVTGASRGLGAAIKAAFEAAGAKVYAPSRGEFNLADSTVPARMWFRAGGKLDILVNNAAVIGPMGPAETNTLADWRECFQVNLFTPMQLCALAVANMKASKTKGSIINISGGGACNPRPGFSAYATSKCGLVRFSETVAEECREFGIRVNCVSPGAMDTRLGAADITTNKEREFADPALAAQLVTFLASDASRPITGKLISAVWDPWPELERNLSKGADMYTLRRVTP